MPNDKEAGPLRDRHPDGSHATSHDTALGLPLPTPDRSEEFLLGFGEGFLVGHARGRLDGMDEYDAQLVEGLVRMLGGPTAETYKDAVDAHDRSLRARARRLADDRCEPRAGDFLGREAAA